jgi:DNA-binding beta-propeller fold protein YncE
MVRKWSEITVVFVLFAVGLVVLSPNLGAFGVSGSVPAPGRLSPGLVAITSRSGDSPFKVLASCLVTEPESDVYDPTDGLIYVASGAPEIALVKPPCHLIAQEQPVHSISPYGTAYDPLTREVVVSDGATGFAYVYTGTKLAKTVWLGGENHCLGLESWDADLGAILIPDACSGGVDVLTLTVVNGITQARVMLNAIDGGNVPSAVLVTDGYIFSAGNVVNVYDDRTLAHLGTFAVRTAESMIASLAWDPLNDTVVLARGYAPAPDSVFFLDASSVRTGAFTFHHWTTHGVFDEGVGGVAYSPNTRELYFSAFNGPYVWELSATGVLTHVYLGKGADPEGLTYDPSNHDMYVCGFWGEMIYVIS